MSLLSKLDQKIAERKGLGPLEKIVSTPKFEAKPVANADAPIEPEEVTVKPEAIPSPYKIDIPDYEEEQGADDTLEEKPVVELSPAKKALLKKSAERIIRRVDMLQVLFLEMILDIEETDKYRFTKDEVDDILDCLPEVLEEKGIELPASVDLGISIAFMVLKRVKMAYDDKKAKKIKEALEAAA